MTRNEQYLTTMLSSGDQGRAAMRSLLKRAFVDRQPDHIEAISLLIDALNEDSPWPMVALAARMPELACTIQVATKVLIMELQHDILTEHPEAEFDVPS